jgi:hypothetical protein
MVARRLLLRAHPNYRRCCYAIGRPLYRGKVALPRALRGSHHLRARYGSVLFHATLMSLVRDRSVLEASVACRARAGTVGGDAGSLGSTGAKRVVHNEVWRAHDGNTVSRMPSHVGVVETGHSEGNRGEVCYPEAGAIGEKSTSLALAQCRCGLGLGRSKVRGHDAVAARSPASRASDYLGASAVLRRQTPGVGGGYYVSRNAGILEDDGTMVGRLKGKLRQLINAEA